MSQPSLIFPIPHHEKEGVSIGGLSIGVETRHEEKVEPILSAVMIIGGFGAIAAGKGKSS